MGTHKRHIRSKRGHGRTVLLGSVFAVIVLGVVFGWMQFNKASGDSSGSASNATVDTIRQALNAVPCIPKLKEPLTVLVMGVDWNGNDAERYVGTRSDTMMLVHFEPSSNRVNITSIPRDSRVHIARHGVSKINQAHSVGGPKLAIETVEDNFDVDIDNYVVVDTAGLRRIFDLLGPVEVVVEKEMRYEDHTSGLSIDLKPGKQLLNAQQLEGYVRFRKDAYADLGRMERQQWFIRQAQQKLSDPAILLKAPQLLATAYDSISTDMPIEKVAEILSFSKDLDGGKIVTATLPGDAETIDGVNYFLVNDDGARTIFSAMRKERQERDNSSEPIIAGDMPAEYMAAHRKRFGRRHRRALEEDQPLDKERVRISIRYPRNLEDYAQSTANSLKEHGWTIRHLIGTGEDDCLHAQVDLHTARANRDIIGLLRNDLPTMAKWPVVLKYGSYGSDLTLVLPATGGLSIWQREASDLLRRSNPTARLDEERSAERTFTPRSRSERTISNTAEIPTRAETLTRKETLVREGTRVREEARVREETLASEERADSRSKAERRARSKAERIARRAKSERARLHSSDEETTARAEEASADVPVEPVKTERKAKREDVDSTEERTVVSSDEQRAEVRSEVPAEAPAPSLAADPATVAQ